MLVFILSSCVYGYGLISWLQSVQVSTDSTARYFYWFFLVLGCCFICFFSLFFFALFLCFLFVCFCVLFRCCCFFFFFFFCFCFLFCFWFLCCFYFCLLLVCFCLFCCCFWGFFSCFFVFLFAFCFICFLFCFVCLLLALFTKTSHCRVLFVIHICLHEWNHTMFYWTWFSSMCEFPLKYYSLTETHPCEFIH